MTTSSHPSTRIIPTLIQFLGPDGERWAQADYRGYFPSTCECLWTGLEETRRVLGITSLDARPVFRATTRAIQRTDAGKELLSAQPSLRQNATLLIWAYNDHLDRTFSEILQVLKSAQLILPEILADQKNHPNLSPNTRKESSREKRTSHF